MAGDIVSVSDLVSACMQCYSDMSILSVENHILYYVKMGSAYSYNLIYNGSQ